MKKNKNKQWKCNICETIVLSEEYPFDFLWADGHKCDFKEYGTTTKLVKDIE